MQKYSNNFWVHLFGKTDHKIIIIVQLFQMHHEGCTYGFILNFTHFLLHPFDGSPSLSKIMEEHLSSSK